MAGHHRFTVVLDACVLYPITVADALMHLAYEDMFAAKWTTLIEDEWLSNVLADKPELQESALRKRLSDMRRAIHDWEVDDQAARRLVPTLDLPDSGDRHVLAAAIVGHADAIITFNLRDFPKHQLQPFGIVAIHPDEFILNQLDLNEIRALGALRAMRQSKKNPPLSAADFIAKFRRNHLVLTADRLQAAANSDLI